MKIKDQNDIEKFEWTSSLLVFIVILIFAAITSYLSLYFLSLPLHLTDLHQNILGPCMTVIFSFIPTWFYLMKPLQYKFNKVSTELHSYEVALQKHAIISRTDPQGRITYANDRFIENSGYSKEELYGKDHRVVNSQHHSAEFWREVWTTLHSHHGWRGQVCNKSKSGRFYWMDTTITSIDNPQNGKVQEYLAIRFDITAEKEQAQKNIQTSKLVSLGEMSASMAHEINNPLTIISGIFQRIEKADENAKIAPAQLAKIRKSIDRIAKIVNSLRKFSHVTPNNDKAIHSLPMIVKEAISLAEIKAHYLDIDIEFDDQIKASILCNDIEVEQVIINIINNSIDAIQNIKEKWIKVELLEDQAQLLLRISDSGAGIPEKNRQLIFDPFYTTKDIGKGTGLGLSISKGIVEDHKGSICLLSENAHTCFEIRFPVAVQDSTKRQVA